eukprot:m.139845 g.139845  ORF g.139845 m.139845 type:complete len:55 (+) comp17070_c1_seq1:534-698(+)
MLHGLGGHVPAGVVPSLQSLQAGLETCAQDHTMDQQRQPGGALVVGIPSCTAPA